MKKSELEILQAWIAIGDRYHFADVHIQMARELGLDPDRIDEVVAGAAKLGNSPLRTFIEILYKRKFGGTKRPPKVRPLRETLAAALAKVEQHKAERAVPREKPEHAIRNLVAKGLVLLLLVGIGTYWFAIREGDAAKRLRAKGELTRIALAVKGHAARTGKTCATLGELGKSLPLTAGRKPLVRDPWGRAYRIDPRLGFVYSAGPDGRHAEKRNATWADDVVAEVEPVSLKLVEVALEPAAAASSATASAGSAGAVLHLTFNKPVLLARNDLPVGPAACAERKKVDYPKGRDGDVVNGKLVRFFEGTPLTFQPGWSPFPEGTVLRLRTGGALNEVLAEFPAGFGDAFQDQVALALTGSADDPHPVFRGVDDALGYEATDEPLEIKYFVESEPEPVVPSGTDGEPIAANR